MARAQVSEATVCMQWSTLSQPRRHGVGIFSSFLVSRLIGWGADVAGQQRPLVLDADALRALCDSYYVVLKATVHQRTQHQAHVHSENSRTDLARKVAAALDQVRLN
jgi:hypothetical protein